LSDGYVTGLEPATGFPFNRSVERRNHRLPRLGAGETVEFDVAFEVLENASEVGACREHIERLQDGKLPLINVEPPLL